MLSTVDWAILALTPFLALLAEGVKRKAIARMQNRVGPPLIQPFYDVIKLWQKEDVKGRNKLFNAMPLIVLINSLALLAFVPLPFVGFEIDFLVFGYLFILLDTFYLLGIFASKSPFGFHSAVRELLLMLGYEISFLVGLAVFLQKAGVSSLALYSQEFMCLQMPLASLAFLAVGFVVLRITPFDVTVAEPEISSGAFTEYSGRKLALIDIAEWVKNFAFCLTAGLLLVGRMWAIPAAFVFVFIYALSQSSSPRYSTFKSVKYFLLVTIFLFIDLVVLI